MENVTTFKYLGRVMKAADEDWPEVAFILQKIRNSWCRILQILSREGVDPKLSGPLFKAVV